MAGNKNSGRPPFEPTDEDREKVRVLKAGGMSNEAIATAVGIAVHTLTKHFSTDLEVGAAKITAEIMMARYNSAKAGNVSAQNKVLEMAGAVRAQESRAPKAEKLGKKEERQRAAEGISGKYATPAPPKLVVSNG
jgi:type IV secretory pathway VirB6-like protein